MQEFFWIFLLSCKISNVLAAISSESSVEIENLKKSWQKNKISTTGMINKFMFKSFTQKSVWSMKSVNMSDNAFKLKLELRCSSHISGKRSVFQFAYKVLDGTYKVKEYLYPGISKTILLNEDWSLWYTAVYDTNDRLVCKQPSWKVNSHH